jgi:hemerythrin-like domain-containing protein/nucleotide-binding universal stress UspA family protein
MYQHILVPTDGSDVSIEAIGGAVAFARDAGAKITFFYAAPDYLATSDGLLVRQCSPELTAELASGDASAILSKAESAARAAGVPFASLCKVSDRPHEAILHAAEEQQCDLIFTSSRGPRSIGGLLLGSETLKLLMHATVPVLVSTVRKNQPVPAMNKAVAILQDEHRSLAVVLHGMKHLLDEAVAQQAAPNPQLMRNMLHYLQAFPESIHHPKEEAYLFARLRLRTQEVDGVIEELEGQHAEGSALLRELELAFTRVDSADSTTLDTFSRALANFTEAQWKHIGLEESIIIPAAKRHLLAEDWVVIAEAFGKNGDPRFGEQPDKAFRKLFSRIARFGVPLSAADSVH